MARRRPIEKGLERTLGTAALFSTAYGNVGSSIYYALGLVAVFALGMTPVIFLISGVIFLLTAATYTEATTMYPEAGGSSSFARHAFNEFWSFFAGWGQMLNYIITVSISAFFVPHYLGVFWEPLRTAPWDIAGGIVVVILLSALNIRGIKEAATLSIVLSVVDFATQVALVILGAILVLSPDILASNIHFGTAPTLANFLIAIPVGMVAYTGIETVSNLSEEAREHHKTVPRSMALVVGAVFAIYLGIPAIALSSMPVVCAAGDCTTQLATTYAGDPILGIVKNLDLGSLQQAGEIYVGILAATILIVATNAGIIGVSRLTYAMGHHRQLPEILRKTHPRFRTPFVAIIVFGLVAAVTIIPGQAEFLGTLYSFGAMLSFTMAHLAVVRLRLSRPTEVRPWRGPGRIRVMGRELPLFAVVGGFGTGASLLTVIALNPVTGLVGSAWVAAGLLTYAIYRRRMGLTLTQTVTVAPPKSAVGGDVEYNSVLVVFEDGKYSAEAMVTAVRLAGFKRRGIHVLATVPVPLSLPREAHMSDIERRAASAIEEARLIGGRRVTGKVLKVRSGQEAAKVIEEARTIRAQAVVVPMARKQSGAGFGRTVEAVLAERPCRVVVTSPPAERKRRREASSIADSRK